MDDVDELSRLWPAFGVQVTCGPLVMRALRDVDFPEVMAVVHAGIHDADRMPFNVPWTRREGPDAERGFLQYHWRTRAELSPEAWSVDLGVWHDGTFVGVQGVATRDFPVTRSGETGSWLGRPYQGRGIGTLMRQAICVTLFDHLGAEEITSAAFLDNPASRAVSRKLGYVDNGQIRRQRREGELAVTQQLLLRPDDLVRPTHPVHVEGAAAVRQLIGLPA